MPETEITDQGQKFDFYIRFYGLLIAPVIVNLLLIPLWMTLPSFWWILIFNIPCYVIIGIAVLIHRTKPRYFEPTRVRISGQGIEVLVPGSKPFQMNWMEFDGIKFRVYGYPTALDTALEIASLGSAIAGHHTPSSQGKARSMRFHFLSNMYEKPIKKYKFLLYDDVKVKMVLRAIVNHAQKMKKELDIHKGTNKYYKLT